MLPRLCSVHLGAGLAAFLVCLVAPHSATAIPYIPPLTGVINQPSLIPPNGVLAVGTTDQQLGTVVTTGTLLSVSNTAGGEVNGSGSQFSVPLGGSTMQTISIWTPSAPFAVGEYTGTGEGSLSGTGTSSFSVVESSADATALTLEFGSVSLTSVQVPATKLPCGTTFGFGAEVIPVSLVTHYKSVPYLDFELLSDAPPEVLSQFLFRPYQPDGPPQSFVPLPFLDGARSGSAPFAAPLDSYCVAVEAVSLINQAVLSLDPVCVADDGRDWEALTPATSAQLDAGLLACPEPPEEYLPRYCALLRDRNTMNANCDAFTDEELDGALENPVVPDETPDQPPAEPSADGAAQDDDEVVVPESAPQEESEGDRDGPAPNLDDSAQAGGPSLGNAGDGAEPNGVSGVDENAPSASDGGCSIGIGAGSAGFWWLLLPFGVLLGCRLRARVRCWDSARWRPGG